MIPSVFTTTGLTNAPNKKKTNMNRAKVRNNNKQSKNPKNQTSDSSTRRHRPTSIDRSELSSSDNKIKIGIEDVISGDSDTEEFSSTDDDDTLSTMKAIMEYNKKLMMRIAELEKQAEEKNNIASRDVNLEPKLQNKRGAETNHNKLKNTTFQLPISNFLKNTDNSDSNSIASEEDDEVDRNTKSDNNEEAEREAASINLDNGEKDDIVVKVEATKKGITFCIHIPRH